MGSLRSMGQNWPTNSFNSVLEEVVKNFRNFSFYDESLVQALRSNSRNTTSRNCAEGKMKWDLYMQLFNIIVAPQRDAIAFELAFFIC